LATKSKKRHQSLRRETWGLRIALYAALLAGVAGVLAFVLLSGGSGGKQTGSPESRFQAIHTFETADFHSLAFSPNQPGTVLFGHHGGVQMSRDGGETWDSLIDEPGRDAMNLVYDPFNPETLYMAGHDVFMKSEDGGARWTSVASNLPSLDLHTFAASPSVANRLYTVPAGSGLYASDDGGAAWTLVSNDVPPGTAAFVELPDGTLLIAATDQGLLRSEDGGVTWVPSRSGIDIGVIFTVRASASGDKLYAGTDHGVYASTNEGKTWTATALDDIWAITIGIDPANPDHILVLNTEGRLFRSMDGGKTWG